MNEREALKKIPVISDNTLESLGMSVHFNSFMEYAATFYSGGADHDFHIDLKVEHSLNVFRYACDMAREEKTFASAPFLARSFLLAALYHDFGRFVQYDRYGTFSDALSLNHAHMAVREIKRLTLLAGEDTPTKRLVLAGVILHNRFALPGGLPHGYAAVSGAVRDVDKLDIMRVMAVHLSGEAPADPVVLLGVTPSSNVTPAILAAVMKRRLVSYAALETTADFALLVCGWMYDLNFSWSRRVAARSPFLAALFDSLPQIPALAQFREQYATDIATYAAEY